MTANSLTLNLYRISINEPGSDLVTLLDVAAPDARKAFATVGVSGLDPGSTLKSSDLLQANVSHVSLGDSILVWMPEHGSVPLMGDTVPVETAHPGVTAEEDIDWSRYEE